MKGFCHWPACVWSLDDCFKMEVPHVAPEYAEGQTLPTDVDNMSNTCFKSLRALSKVPVGSRTPAHRCVPLHAQEHCWCASTATTAKAGCLKKT